jgi:peptidoglycan/LPS O-acetylase OafA/YrhL
VAEDATSDPGWRLGYRPQLDGVRGLAVLVVVAFHTPLRAAIPGGFLGVDLFFVLSGFLITVLLAEEHRDAGRIRPLRFFARRMVRLLPALLVLLAFCSFLALGCRSPAKSYSLFRSVLLTLTYSANWYWVFDAPLHYLAHTWSLALEEQFYLLWPFALMALLRCRSRPISLALVGMGIAAAALLRAAVWEGPATFSHHPATTCLAMRADALLAGCSLGLMAVWGWLTHGRSPLLRCCNASAALFLLTVVLTIPSGDVGLYRGGFTLVALAAAFWLAGVVQDPPRLLCWSPLTWIGRLSYGIYLWHYPLFALVPGWLRKLGVGSPGGVLVWSAEVALTLGAAAASYYGVERPIRRWGCAAKPRVAASTPRSPGSAAPSRPGTGG